jgi:WhiB family redox-sensing transcriptional regulator
MTDGNGVGSWRVHAACRGVDPDLFFPARGEMTAPAKAVCSSCPVRSECLTDALEQREKFGIWGGRSERERRQIRKRQRAA